MMPGKQARRGMCDRRSRESSKSQWNQAYPGIPDRDEDTTCYIQASTIIGRNARRYWLSGVRRAEIGTEDLEGDFNEESCHF